MTEPTIPKGCGICPVCNGTGRVVPSGEYLAYKTMYSDYDKETDTLACKNCGGQTMYGKASGLTRLRADGTPCEHEFVGYNAGRCYTKYECKHCRTTYDIDSGD